jgi:hypothetical protein
MHAKGTPMIQLVSTDSLNDWTPDTVMGKIIVYMDGASDAESRMASPCRMLVEQG